MTRSPVAASSPWHSREDASRCDDRDGVGGALLEQWIRASETAGTQAGIFSENAASIAAHFRVVGRGERLGRHHGKWRDVLLRERRSFIAGA